MVKLLASTVAIVSFLAFAALAGDQSATVDIGHRITGPVTRDNLAIFLLHGTSVPGPVPATLQEALAGKKIKLHEKGNVNELEIENVGDDEVFVQAGDIVKGGQQDRVLSVSLVVPPRSGRMPISAFCVESGRWTKRGAEDARSFGSAEAMMPSRASKLAMAKPEQQGAGAAQASQAGHRQPGDASAQQKVWSDAARIQGKLSAAIGAPVAAAQSPSSLKLALESRRLADAEAPYVDALKPSGEKDDDIVGDVIVVNGKLSSADVYLSNGLFRKMWPKLLNAAVVEALAEKDGARGDSAPSAETVRKFLEDGATGPASVTEVNRDVRLSKRESADVISVETVRAKDGQWLYRSYLAP